MPPARPKLPAPHDPERLLDAIEVKERAHERRQTPNLMIVLAPLWAWVLGVAYLPETLPSFARGLFHASCWAGFAWFLRKAWLGRAHDSRARSRRSS